MQRLRSIAKQPELLQREAALSMCKAAMHCFDCHVAGRTSLRISARQHDARTGALKVTVKRLVELEAGDRSAELRWAGLHRDVEGPPRGVHHVPHPARR